jgi:hypothetical protein
LESDNYYKENSYYNSIVIEWLKDKERTEKGQRKNRERTKKEQRKDKERIKKR